MASIENKVVSLEFDNGQFLSAVEDTIKGLEDLKKALELKDIQVDTANIEKNLKVDVPPPNTDGFAQGLNKVAGVATGLKNILLSLGISQAKSMGQASKATSVLGSNISSVSQRVVALSTITATAVKGMITGIIDAAKNLSSSIFDPIFGGGLGRVQNFEKANFLLEGLEFSGTQIEKIMEKASAAVDGTAYGLDQAASYAAKFAVGRLSIGKMEGALKAVAGTAAITSTSFEEIGEIFSQIATEGDVSTMRLQQLETRGLAVFPILAKEMGVTEAALRQMVTNGEVDFETFADAMDNAFGEHAQAANKTFPGALANVKSALSRVGQAFLEPGYEAAIPFFNDVREKINEAKEALMPLAGVFGEFSTKTLGRLSKFVQQIDFSSLTDGLKEGSENLERFRRIFDGIAAFGHILFTVIRGVASAIGRLFGVVMPANGGFLEFLATIGDMVVKFDEAISKGNEATGLLGLLITVLQAPIVLLEKLGAGFRSLVSDMGGAQAVGQAIVDFFAGLPKAINGSVNAVSLNSISGLLGAVFIGGIYGTFKALSIRIRPLLGGLLQTMNTALYQVTLTLKEMQLQIRAKAIMDIAKAVAVLAASLFLVAMIPPAQMASGLAGIAGLAAILFGLTQALVKFNGMKSAITLFIMGPAIQSIANSVLILAAATALLGYSLERLSRLSWEEIAKGIVSLTAVMALMTATSVVMSKAGGSFLRAAISLGIFAISVRILAGAIQKLGNMKISTIATGLGAITAAIIAIGAAMRTFPKNIMKQALALVAVSLAVGSIADAIESMGGLSVKVMAKGIVGLAAAIVALGLAAQFMSGNIFGAIALGVLATSLSVLAGVILMMGQADIKTVAIGLGVLAATLLIFAGLSAVLSPMIPVMLGLSATLLVLGAGMALLGLGVSALATGLTALIAILMDTNNSFGALVAAIIKHTPAAVAAAGNMIFKILDYMSKNMGRFVTKGAEVIVKFLNGLRKEIPAVSRAGANLIIAIIVAIGRESQRVATAAGETLLKFLEGMLSWMRQNQKRFNSVGRGIAASLLEGVTLGLLSSENFNKVKAAIDKVANLIPDWLKKLWGIKSPSKVTANLASFLGLGIVQGIRGSERPVEKSAKSLARTAVRVLSDAMGNVEELDVNPTIAPVLDLTDFRNEAAKISGLLTPKQTGLTSMLQAREIASAQANRSNDTEQDKQPTPTEIKFEQNNYSPEALSDIEIYRNTKSQLELAKRELVNNAV